MMRFKSDTSAAFISLKADVDPPPPPTGGAEPS